MKYTLLDNIVEILSPYASQFVPKDSDVKAVIHQWIHAITYQNEVFGASRGADKKNILGKIKASGYYKSATQIKKDLRDSININPMKKPQFTFIDLFAGIGGMRQGFESAGGACVFSSEYDTHAQKTYLENYGEFPFGDITKIANGELGENNWVDAIPYHDILLGGFPCQAFSIAGYREGFNDKKGRGNLFFRIAEIIEAKRPKAYLLENVKNLVGHDKGNTLKVIKDILREKLGYSCDHFVLNSTEFGNIPQNRERTYLVGFKNEAKFKNNDDIKQDNVYTHRFQVPKPIKLTKTIFDVISSERQPSRFYYPETHQYFDELNRAITSRDTVYQWRRVYVRENKSNVCPTLTANMGTGGHNVPIIRDDFGIRKFTPEECIGFQGFPKEFRFPVDMAMSHRYKQAGNSVVVPVVKRIAVEVVKAINSK